LDQACGADLALRQEVESLLSIHERAADFIESPAYRVAPELLSSQETSGLDAGAIAGYQILELLGRGGMGEVYLALDQELGRRVALKVLPDRFSGDEERLRRFKQEARAASALCHPNVAHIYELRESGGRRYIAMEYVLGETLRRSLSHGRPTIQAALDFAAQIASALAAAHQAGIVHRDIKPENIMLRPDGSVRVLDFGLAKLVEGRDTGGEAGLPTSPTLTTDPGAVMGTPTYMSPEQARGRPVDERTDIFSLGVVLYEMIAGRPPFEGPSPSDVIAAILEKEAPPLSQYAPEVPAEAEQIVARALRKDTQERYQSVTEMLTDLSTLRRNLAGEPAPGRRSSLAPALNPAAPGLFSLLDLTRSRKARLLMATAALPVVATLTYYLIERQHNLPKRTRSLVVMPFKPLNPGVDEEALGLGLANDLVTRLSSTRQIIVTPTISASRFTDEDLDPADIGRKLGVDAVLIGTVQRAGDRIRLNAQLLRTDDRAPLWADTLDERAADILTVQDRLSERLSQALALHLTGEQQRLLTKQYTKDAEAFQLYMTGYYHWKKRTREGFNLCADYYHEALRKDPDYALAYAGLAATYSSQSVLGFAAPNEAMPQAEAAARRALEIDDTLPTAHVALAAVRSYYYWDAAGGEAEFQKAIQLDSNYVEAHQYYGLCLAAMGRFADSWNQLQIARQLDPTSPSLEGTTTYSLYLAGQYDEVIARCRKAIEVDPTFLFYHLHLGHALAAKGMYERAISAFQKARLSSNAPFVVARLGYACGAAGRKRQARELLDEMLQVSAQPHYIALVYIGLGEPDRAIDWLRKAELERSGDLIYLKTDPIYRSLASNPKFTELLERVGFHSVFPAPIPTLMPPVTRLPAR
jgi:serine/threonine protein kinase/Flp pilus assembly protein TadD